MVPVFCLSCNEMIIKKWESLVSKEGSCELDIWPSIQSLTSDVISRTGFGSNYKEGERIFELLSQQAQGIMKSWQGGNNIVTR